MPQLATRRATREISGPRPGKFFFQGGHGLLRSPTPVRHQIPVQALNTGSGTKHSGAGKKRQKAAKGLSGAAGGARLSRPVVRAEGRRAATEATKLPAQWLHWPAGFGPLRRPVDHISSFRVATACSRSLSAPASSFGSALIDRPLEAAQQLAGCRVPIITVVRVVLVALG